MTQISSSDQIDIDPKYHQLVFTVLLLAIKSFIHRINNLGISISSYFQFYFMKFLSLLRLMNIDFSHDAYAESLFSLPPPPTILFVSPSLFFFLFYSRAICTHNDKSQPDHLIYVRHILLYFSSHINICLFMKKELHNAAKLFPLHVGSIA